MTPWEPIYVDGRLTGYLRTVIVDRRPQIDALCPDGVDGYRSPRRDVVDQAQLELVWGAA